MTTPQASPPPPGTAIAPTDPVAKILAERNQMRTVQKALRQSQWGRDLDERTFKSVVLWAERRGIDLATELTVIGGNIYLEADYYLRRLAQQVGAGNVVWAYPDHVHLDKRLVQLIDDEKAPVDVRERARAEHYRRIEERARYNLPDAALAACVYHVRIKGMERDFVGAKAVGNIRGKTQGGKLKDPIGEESPVETSESRSARRACRQFIDTFPDLKAEMDLIEGEAKLLSVEIVEARKRQPSSMLQRDPMVRTDGYEAFLDPEPKRATLPATPGGAQTITEAERKHLYGLIEDRNIEELVDEGGDHEALHALLRRVRGLAPDAVVHLDTQITLDEYHQLVERIQALPPIPEVGP